MRFQLDYSFGLYSLALATLLFKNTPFALLSLFQTMFSCGSWFTSSSSEQNSAAAPATATESVGLLQRLKDSAPLNLLLFPAPPAEPLAVRRRAAAAEGMAAPELDDVVPLYLPPYGDPVYLMPCPGAQQVRCDDVAVDKMVTYRRHTHPSQTSTLTLPLPFFNTGPGRHALLPRQRL